MALNFELHTMGWFSFEGLCRTIVRTTLGPSVEAYSRGADAGRDGMLKGPWTTHGEAVAGVIQCKHRSAADSSLTLADVSSELPKIAKMAAAQQCDVYLLMTNAKVSGGAASKIEEAVIAAGADACHIYGYETICDLLTEDTTLRALVPRVYGLGDLTEILNESKYAQAQVILATMHDDLARLVPVAAHTDTHSALAEHGFALLIGRPGSGKTSIAGSLAVAAIDEFGAAPIKLQHIGEFTDHWNPKGHPQFFWVDDVFGANQYDERSTIEWNRAAQSIRAAVETGTRLICTSRDYVFNAARSDLRIAAFPLLDSAQVLIEVEGFSREEREQMLYNHLKLGQQPPEFREKLKSTWLESAAASEHFLPELARRFADPVFTDHLARLSEWTILDFFARPEQYLLDVLIGLDGASRAALGLLHLRGGRLDSPVVPTATDGEFLGRVGVTLAEAVAALQALDESLVRLVVIGAQRYWAFHHPTFTDAYRIWLAKEPELLREYVLSTPLSTLLSTVTCGDREIEGALILPESLGGVVAERLSGELPRPDEWKAQSTWSSKLWPFLARRCDDDFLAEFVGRYPRLVNDAFNIGAYLNAHGQHQILAKRLLEAGVASEAQRLAMVEQLMRLAVDGIDGTFLTDDEWLWFFREDELQEMLSTLESETLPALDDLIREEISSIGNNDFFDAIRDSVHGYGARFPDSTFIDSALEVLASADPGPSASDLASDEWREVERDAGRTDSMPRPSIFDDLAE